MDDPATLPRKRLSDAKTRQHLLPLVRASAVKDVSLYWLPVNQFPIGFRQRLWILGLLDALTEDLKADKQAVETFLQLKFARTELNERFTLTMMEYRPMTGILLAPGGKLPESLTSLEAKRLSENPGKDGTIDIDYLAPDYAAWFAGTQASQQRQDFFGIGGMMMLWIDEGGEPAAPKFEMPNVLRSHPAMKGVDLDGQMKRGMRLQHPFLARSREVFAAHLPDGMLKRHSLFILPLLTAPDFVDATPDQRASWFEIFSAYCIESPRDKGILLAFRSPDFDERLIDVLDTLREKLGDYPL